MISAAEKTVGLLKKHNLKIASAESCTGGMFSRYITAVSGASSVFELGIASYSSRIKHKILNVNEDTLKKEGAISSNTASQMAENIRSLADADIGVAVTGNAGPSADENKAVGLVYIALSFKNKTEVKKMNIIPKSRELVRKTVCLELFNLICEHIRFESIEENI